jgi:nitroreductase
MNEDAMPDEIHGTDLFEIIRTTRSMRRLKPDPVPNEPIRKILEAGVCAPSGGNMQRWRFLVNRDAKITGDCRGLIQACVGRAGCAAVSVW